MLTVVSALHIPDAVLGKRPYAVWFMARAI